MRPKNLSSSLTFMVKFVFPGLFVIGFGTGALSLFVVKSMKNGMPVPGVMKWLFLCGWIAGIILFGRTCFGLKKVRTDGVSLYISNFLREIAVPLGDVAGVAVSDWARRSPVTLRLKQETAFGKAISFLPEPDSLAFWRTCPDSVAIGRFACSESAP